MNRTTTRHGLSILFWTLLFSLGLSQAIESAGLKWVQGVVWPSDLHSFAQLEPRPVDVAILGSSRASFAVSPSALDLCLEKELGRSTESVNLARTFATAWSAEILADELLSGERTPAVLVLAVGPEFFDENNPQRVTEIDAHINLKDVPEAVGESRNLHTLIATLRPLGHGIERSALYLAGRHDEDPHLRWMMLHHGGGQYCLESQACEENNRAIMTLLGDRWDAYRVRANALMKARFKNYKVGEGPVHESMLSLIDWARSNDVELMVAEVPLHQEFRHRIPPNVWRSYRAYLARLETEHGVARYTPESPSWAKTRTRYLDPDHLSDRGSFRYTQELCQALVPRVED